MQKRKSLDVGLDCRFGNLLLAVLCALLVRWTVSFHPHSGEGKPPMFGDYEAQRHWMEVTVNLPLQDWYTNTPDNDLLYWGLDYPPLTAYHSLLLGKIATVFNDSYVQLHKSRGLETPQHKTFMRATVIASDVLIFFAATIFYFHVLSQKQRSYTPVCNDFLFLTLLYPGLILVDHGHFQYNCVSLGLTIAAIAFIFNDQILPSAFFFCLALNYKQMSLYHSLPFFVYMLGLCFYQRNFIQGLALLLKLSCVVIVTFLLIWSPFLWHYESMGDVITRLFPVGRGVFEDKVANIWCTFNIIYKIKIFWTPDFTLRVAMLATVLASIPSLITLVIYPTHRRFLLSLINVSLAFFLFSYQVHEKSILLVALPVLLYAPYDLLPCAWFLGVSTVSLQHLIVKDNLHIAFISVSVLFYSFLLFNDNFWRSEKLNWTWVLALAPTVVGGCGIYIGFLFIPPPLRYPDLWPLINAVYSCVHFVLFFIYFNYCLLKTDLKKLPPSRVGKASTVPRRNKRSSRTDSFD